MVENLLKYLCAKMNNNDPRYKLNTPMQYNGRGERMKQQGAATSSRFRRWIMARLKSLIVQRRTRRNSRVSHDMFNTIDISVQGTSVFISSGVVTGISMIFWEEDITHVVLSIVIDRTMG